MELMPHDLSCGRAVESTRQLKDKHHRPEMAGFLFNQKY
jgi:hypothetical protein